MSLAFEPRPLAGVIGADGILVGGGPARLLELADTDLLPGSGVLLGDHDLVAVLGVERIDGWVGEGIGVRAYFNHDVEGAAVRDARWLRDAVVADG